MGHGYHSFPAVIYFVVSSRGQHVLPGIDKTIEAVFAVIEQIGGTDTHRLIPSGRDKLARLVDEAIAPIEAYRSYIAVKEIGRFKLAGYYLAPRRIDITIEPLFVLHTTHTVVKIHRIPIDQRGHLVAVDIDIPLSPILLDHGQSFAEIIGKIITARHHQIPLGIDIPIIEILVMHSRPAIVEAPLRLETVGHRELLHRTVAIDKELVVPLFRGNQHTTGLYIYRLVDAGYHLVPLLVDTTEDSRLAPRLGLGLHHHPGQASLEIVDERIFQMQVENIGCDFYFFLFFASSTGRQKRDNGHRTQQQASPNSRVFHCPQFLMLPKNNQFFPMKEGYRPTNYHPARFFVRLKPAGAASNESTQPP